MKEQWALKQWAYTQEVRLLFIGPGKRVQNPHSQGFLTIRGARQIIGAWQPDYNTVWPIVHWGI